MSINRVDRIDDLVPIRNIIVSVADKTGLEGFIPGLIALEPEIHIYSTGATYERISEILGEEWAQNLTTISDYTGHPEMQGGLVKTLDFRIYLGLLSETYNEAHVDDLLRTKAVVFDMVVCNLYPFGEASSQEGATPEDARGNIDIGGPCLLRAAAKNYLRVAAVCDPLDYPDVLGSLRKNGGSLDLETRYQCAQKAFSHTGEYEKLISEYFHETRAETLRSTYTIAE